MLEERREARIHGLPQQEEEERDRLVEYARAAEFHQARLRLETREARITRLDREGRRRREFIREGGQRNLEGGQRWWDGGNSGHSRRWE